eukprot:7374087-Pyramimonas_sp.AAC.1
MLRRTLLTRDVQNKRVLKDLMKCMHFDDRRGGYVLFKDFAPLGLRKGCRLIEAGAVVDLHELLSIDLPTCFTFFDTN